MAYTFSQNARSNPLFVNIHSLVLYKSSILKWTLASPLPLASFSASSASLAFFDADSANDLMIICWMGRES